MATCASQYSAAQVLLRVPTRSPEHVPHSCWTSDELYVGSSANEGYAGHSAPKGARFALSGQRTWLVSGVAVHCLLVSFYRASAKSRRRTARQPAELPGKDQGALVNKLKPTWVGRSEQRARTLVDRKKPCTQKC